MQGLAVTRRNTDDNGKSLTGLGFRGRSRFCAPYRTPGVLAAESFWLRRPGMMRKL